MDRLEVRRALDELIAGRWVLSYEVDHAGVRTYTARRPVGWIGGGDPFVKLEAPSYRELFAVIADHVRHGGVVPGPRDGGAR